MSSTPIANGQQSSASGLNQTFSGLQDQGNAILSLLSQIQLTTLLDYSHRLTDLTSKQQRAARVQAADIVALFVVSDFGSVNQGLTTATVRVDTASATLRERRFPNTALVSSTSFSVTSGTVNALNKNQTLLSVFSPTAPTGTFTMELQEPVNLSVMTIALAAMASAPAVTVQVSTDGLIYTPAASTSLNGSVLNAWFAEQSVQFIQLILTPSHPDNLGGNTYTFGITDFSASTVAYNLVSDVVFRPVILTPQTQSLVFRAQGTAGIIYNLLLDDGAVDGSSYVAVTDGSLIPVPNAATVTQAACAVDIHGKLTTADLPANFYINSVAVIDNTTGLNIPVVHGLDPADANIASVTRTYAAFKPAGSGVPYLTIIPAPLSTTGTYKVSYIAGPASVSASLLVHLSTNDRTQTPVFRAASLEE
jgi:hypothetical protein